MTRCTSETVACRMVGEFIDLPQTDPAEVGGQRAPARQEAGASILREIVDEPCVDDAVAQDATGPRSDAWTAHVGAVFFDRAISLCEQLVQQEGRGDLASKLARARRNKAIAVRELGEERAGAALIDQTIALYERLVLHERQYELAHDLATLGAGRVLLVTDAGVAAAGHPARIAERLTVAGLEVTTYDGTRVEPTDASLAAAADFARESGPFDVVLAVGGGSSIDTAKAVSLLVSNPGEVIDYVNPPVGGGRAPVRPLVPLVAVLMLGALIAGVLWYFRSA